MQTVEQALKLLDYFSERQPEYGLTELAQRAGFDKAKTRRYLIALIRQGFVEQHPASKKYRLGAALLRLARVREACFPVDAVVTPILTDLVARCGETAHFSLMSGAILGNVSVVESPRAHRITMERGEILPLHATASGLVWLAHSPAPVIAAFLKRRLEAFTPATETTPEKLERKLAQIRKQGIARTAGSYDEGVTSYAMPIRGAQAYAIGALAIAAPTSRIDKRVEAVIVDELRASARQIESAIGGIATTMRRANEPG
jgi:IclR family transcriptional regulator, acetate operon repressor